MMRGFTEDSHQLLIFDLLRFGRLRLMWFLLVPRESLFRCPIELGSVLEGSTVRVLIVEDYFPIRRAVAKGLAEQGFEVEISGDGKDAVWKAVSFPFDVIILDIMLPGMDGCSVLKTIREKQVDAHVLLLTAKDSVEDRVHGLNLGADDYLVKPFEFSELLARVHALVRRKYQKKNPTIKIEDLEIDTLSKKVTRCGTQIDLTAREYNLLEYLGNRVGEVVSRTEIWEHVYEVDGSGNSNVVDVYIGYLRKKLETPGLEKLIHTRRGQGYVLGRQE